MAVTITRPVAEKILDDMLGINTSGNQAYLKINGVQVNCQFIKGTDSTTYTAVLYVPVMIAVSSGVVVDTIQVGRVSTVYYMFNIKLTGDDIVSFVNNGTYVVNTLEVTIGG